MRDQGELCRGPGEESVKLRMLGTEDRHRDHKRDGYSITFKAITLAI